MTAVDVIIPTLNRASTLARALQSLNEQDHVDMTVLVVDQGSSDGTPALLERLAIRYVNESVRGAGAARNRGLAETKNPFVLFLDSDDWLRPDALRPLLSLMESSEADIAYGIAIPRDENSRTEYPKPLPPPAPLPSASILRRDVFRKFGQMDIDNYSFPRWIIEARRQGLSEARLREPVCYRGIHLGNVSRSPGSARLLFDLVRFHRSVSGG
jgi:glycosyltransferase involved in cell wall biosynthesis